jgi:hypothetical protein
MSQPKKNWPPGVPPVNWKEHLLVLGLGLTFLLCIFVSLPQAATDDVISWRYMARSYLRTFGVDQYWPMFVGDRWDIPELRIMATSQSGTSQEITNLLMQKGWLYENILDDRMRLDHMQIARGTRPAVLDSYAAVLARKLGPEVRQVRFEAVHRTVQPRKTARGTVTAAVIPLAVYSRSTEGAFEKE